METCIFKYRNFFFFFHCLCKRKRWIKNAKRVIEFDAGEKKRFWKGRARKKTENSRDGSKKERAVILIGCLRSFKVIPNGIVINLTKSKSLSENRYIHTMCVAVQLYFYSLTLRINYLKETKCFCILLSNVRSFVSNEFQTKINVHNTFRFHFIRCVDYHY